MSISERLRSRRSVITAAIAAAAGMTAGRLAGASEARAADGDPLILGATNEAAGFTVLNNTSPGVQALTITVPGGGVGLRAESEAGEGMFGTSNGAGGIGVWGNNTAGGNGVTGTSDSGIGVKGATGSGVAVFAEVGDGPGLALRALGPVQFSTIVMATVPQGQSTVTVAPVTGKEQQPLDLTEGSTMVLCTLLQNPGSGEVHPIRLDRRCGRHVHRAPERAGKGISQRCVLRSGPCFVLNRLPVLGCGDGQVFDAKMESLTRMRPRYEEPRSNALQ